MTRPIRIVVADDHPLFRAGLRALLESVPDTEVVGEAATGEEAVQAALTVQPDVIVMDINMPELNGIDAAQDETLRAIRSVANGEAIFSPRIAARLQRFLAGPPPADPGQRFPQLTDRELEILNLLAQRRTNGQIAAQLYLSQKTVRNYVSAI